MIGTAVRGEREREITVVLSFDCQQKYNGTVSLSLSISRAGLGGDMMKTSSYCV